MSPLTALDDAVSTAEDTSVEITVLDNDVAGSAAIDPGSLAVSVVASLGIAEVSGDGLMTYRPHPDLNGEDSFSYSICDLGGFCEEASVVVTIEPVNDPPVAQPDTVSVLEDGTVAFDPRVNDADDEGGPIEVSSVGTADNGSVSSTTASITYTPNPDFNGADSFIYTLRDGDGACDVATVTVTVDPVNDSPIAFPDAAETDWNTPVSIAVLTNDIDVDGDVLTVTLTGAPATGAAHTDGTQIVYEPAAGVTGLVVLEYLACDPHGACSSTEVSVTVVSVVPVVPVVPVGSIVSNDNYMARSGIPTMLDVLVNDDTSILDPSTLTVLSGPDHGTFMIVGHNRIKYRSERGFAGTDTLTYQVCTPQGDCFVAMVTIEVS